MNREAIVLSAAFFASLVPGDPAKSFTLPWSLPANAVLLGYHAACVGSFALVLLLPVQVAPVLPGTVPVLQWFAQERGFEGPLGC